MDRRELRLLPESLSNSHEEKRHGQGQRRDAAEDTHCGPDAEIQEHGPRGERQARREQTTQNSVRRHGARGVQLVGVDEEVDTLLEDDVEAGADEAGGHDGRRPRDVCVGGPAEPEEADGEAHAAEHHGE